MSKKKKQLKSAIDFDIGIGEVIPATQEAFQDETVSLVVRKQEKANLSVFKLNFSAKIDANIRDTALFPTDNEVFIFIVQYFASEKEYKRRDIDNMAKTILDVAKGRFYYDDSQVKTLLIGKKMERRVPQNFAYIAIKRLSSTQDVDALKISGLERSVTMFQELKKQGIL